MLGANMSPIHIRKYLLAALSCFTLISFADEVSLKDNTQDVEITSNTFEYNNQTGVATYIGDVYAQQGSRILLGDRLEVYRDSLGDISKIIAYGQPAQHESFTDIDKPKLHAKANEIIYDMLKEHLTLVDDAYVEQAGDIYEAPRIEYDVANEIVSSPENDSGRTTITLKPRSST